MISEPSLLAVLVGLHSISPEETNACKQEPWTPIVLQSSSPESSLASLVRDGVFPISDRTSISTFLSVFVQVLEQSSHRGSKLALAPCTAESISDPFELLNQSVLEAPATISDSESDSQKPSPGEAFSEPSADDSNLQGIDHVT